MSFLIELVSYVIGAIAFLSTLFTPISSTTSHATTTVKISTVSATTTTAKLEPRATASLRTTIEQSKTKPVIEEKSGNAPLYFPTRTDPSLAKSKTERSETSPSLPTSALVSSLPQLPTIPPETVASSSPQFSWDAINEKTRAALVNIICTTKRGGLFQPVSGSGVIIDPRGVILTNAHVAEYLLLKDYLTPDFIDCVIRTGEPAQNHYRVEPLYISQQWIQDNRREIISSDHEGTGENDFALLLITKTVNEETLPLPAAHPFLPMDFTDETLQKKYAVLVAGYPAGELGGISIQKEFYPVSSTAIIKQVYSFGTNTPDLFGIHGSVLAEQGSSGGAVVNIKGKLIGIIATATDAPTTGEREMNAITPSHINRSFGTQNTFSLENMLATDDLLQLLQMTEQFNRDIAPQLTKMLTDEINK